MATTQTYPTPTAPAPTSAPVPAPTLARTPLTAAAEAIRQLDPDAATVQATPVGQAASVVAPYHCTACGSDNPYRAGRMKHRGGLGCKSCRAVTKAIQDAHLGTLRRLTAPAYRPGVHGEEKQRIIRYAEAVAHQAWAAASRGYGIDVPSSAADAMVAELRALVAAGQLEPGALVDIGMELLNVAQDAEMAAEGRVAA